MKEAEVASIIRSNISSKSIIVCSIPVSNIV